MSLFRKILIANRGEIACRVIHTARGLGIETVAIYSDADASARHVELADEAWHVGPPAAADSYLQIPRILEVAKASGAEAIHPGYGFLSENAAFAEACEAAGLVFIGPTADSIRAMGLKDAAKIIMEKAGVPVVPGYHGGDQSEDVLRKEADGIGYPVLIKAVAGGGGKGMRQVESAEEFAQALKLAAAEGASSFGDATVLVEKLITRPRHIEIQVFGDGEGNAVHLFERDCSLQRRHQKVVEEAPAPDMPAALRVAMGDAAVEAAKAIQYRGAGTVEFIVDIENGIENAPFYFMEMNTRLQVEHPVTEMVTGEDLVAWQLRIAAGEGLPKSQDELTLTGHAFEVRLYAEDAARDFMPSTGTLARFRTPAETPTLRVETGVREGDEVTVHYDPMIAKLVVSGATREAALSRLAHALDHTHIAGLTSNVPFLRLIARHPAFASGDVDTGFIARHGDDLRPRHADLTPEDLALASLLILAEREQIARVSAAGSPDQGSPWHDATGWRLNLDYSESLDYVGSDGTEHQVTFKPDGAGFLFRVDGNDVYGLTQSFGNGDLRAIVDGHTCHVVTAVNGNRITLMSDGRSIVLDRLSHTTGDDEEATGPGAVLAPMPGKVLDVMTSEGATVMRGDPLIVVEAMKMQHTLTAPRDGIVTLVTVAAGDQVADGAVLIQIEEE